MAATIVIHSVDALGNNVVDGRVCAEYLYFVRCGMMTHSEAMQALYPEIPRLDYGEQQWERNHPTRW